MKTIEHLVEFELPSLTSQNFSRDVPLKQLYDRFPVDKIKFEGLLEICSNLKLRLQRQDFYSKVKKYLN